MHIQWAILVAHEGHSVKKAVQINTWPSVLAVFSTIVVYSQRIVRSYQYKASWEVGVVYLSQLVNVTTP